MSALSTAADSPPDADGFAPARAAADGYRRRAAAALRLRSLADNASTASRRRIANTLWSRSPIRS